MSADTETALPDGLGFDFSDIEPEAVSGTLGASRTGAPRKRRGPGKTRLTALQKKLSQEMFQAGTLCGLALPVTGYYIGQESDAFTHAMIQLASSRPEWIEALEHVADIGPGLVIGRTAIGIGASFAVDRGRADPEKKAMMFLGVYSAWKAIHQPGEPRTEEGSAYTPPPSGAFVPVA